MNEKPDNMSAILDNVLFPTEEALYKKHFKKEFWSLHDFSALMGGISPERLQLIVDGSENQVTEKEFKSFKDANKIYEKFFAYVKKSDSEEKIKILKKDIVISPWRYIKWLAAFQIPIKKKIL